MKALYERYLLPHLIGITCGTGQVMKQRSLLVPKAYGQVLEVGFGGGLNLDFYDQKKVTKVWALEPSHGMRAKSADLIRQSLLDIEWLDLPGEQIPLPDNSVDSIVLTYTLCTIPDWQAALQQMKRVLKPGGLLLFSEHGASCDHPVKKWQDRITPAWKPFAGGCHLNRPIADMIKGQGFEILELEQNYLPKAPKTLAYNYRGVATIKS